MTPKQVLDSFSQTLLEDKRILSAQERALLAMIVHHANLASSGNPQTQEAVRAVIASSVGEIVGQRAFAVLGGSIVERILEGDTSFPVREAAHSTTEYLGPKDPQPPTAPGQHGTPTAPAVPAPSPQPADSPVRSPQPPSPGPQPPHAATTVTVSQSSIALAERPQTLPARCVVLDEFLAPQELAELTRFTLDHEGDFRASEVVSPYAEGGMINYEHRSSRVLMDLGQYQDMMLERIKTVLPQVLRRLQMEEFRIVGVEAQITASNDRDFFRFHADNASGLVASRYLTFVYFFHREPRAFEGGELRIHDARLDQGSYASEGTYQAVIPRQNQIVFFPCELMHEITPLKCPSRRFADSRFTLNGWLRR
ncbi:MAG TPA: 2OG-Fe(II) oxygenase [Candidatus Sulfotelmatobacter sp.]|nr:2OG-Fe(II) oxygenase [Candidatus Sulfotelmatobacter sp.]